MKNGEKRSDDHIKAVNQLLHDQFKNVQGIFHTKFYNGFILEIPECTTMLGFCKLGHITILSV